MLYEKNCALRACEEFLALLPESECDAGELAYALAYFGIKHDQIEDAAAKLPELHDIKFRGVRQIIARYIESFVGIFCEKDERSRCEVSVPSPLPFIMSFQLASEGKIRFQTDALIANIVLRSFFLYCEEQAAAETRMRFCGLNRMRLRLSDTFDYAMQFGVLCDECIKCGEMYPDRVIVMNAVYPKECDRMHAKRISDAFEIECRKAMGIEKNSESESIAMRQYARLVGVQNELVKLNNRPERKPLKGNSFALAQTVQLCVFDRWDGVLAALNVLCDELKNADKRENRRTYCFFTPFLQPQTDSLFRQNGIDLMGSAVFLYNNNHASFNSKDMIADWLLGMGVRKPAEAEGELIAKAVKAGDSCAYITGMYDFDRWMGPASGIHREQIEKFCNIPTFAIDLDFWNGTGDIADKIESICEMIKRR